MPGHIKKSKIFPMISSAFGPYSEYSLVCTLLEARLTTHGPLVPPPAHSHLITHQPTSISISNTPTPPHFGSCGSAAGAARRGAVGGVAPVWEQQAVVGDAPLTKTNGFAGTHGATSIFLTFILLCKSFSKLITIVMTCEKILVDNFLRFFFLTFFYF